MPSGHRAVVRKEVVQPPLHPVAADADRTRACLSTRAGQLHALHEGCRDADQGRVRHLGGEPVMSAVRLEIVTYDTKTHEVVVETLNEATRLWYALCRKYYELGKPLGGASMHLANLPPSWYAFPGQSVAGTHSWRWYGPDEEPRPVNFD